jgi:P pilus assembly chaperone PapD
MSILKNRTPFTEPRGFRLAILILLPILATMSPAVLAGAQVSISPTRVVFEGRTRTASVTLINRGNEASTFRISFEHKRMTEDGQFETIKNPKQGEFFSDQMIRYSPRQVILPPGQSQVVRLLLRKPPDLVDGEYRSHMLFREVPEQQSRSIEAQTSKQKQMIISIKPVLGISIPVIVRQGKTSAEVQLVKARLTNISPDKTKGVLELKMQRTGNRSVYGDILATYRKNENDKKGVVVAQINGIAVYTPNDTRTVKLPVQAPARVKLDGGRIVVVYRTSPKEGNKVLAQGLAEVPAAK